MRASRYRKTGIPIIPSLLYLLTVFSSETSSASREGQDVPRILGGKFSTITSFPFLCTVQAKTPDRNITLASCTILSQRYVLFSIDSYDRYLSHFHSPPNELFVYAGGVTLQNNNWKLLQRQSVNKRGVRIKVEAVIIGQRPKLSAYDKYDDYITAEKINGPLNDPARFFRNALGDLENDVGLLRLAEEFEFSAAIVQAPLIARTLDRLRNEFKIIHQTESYGDCVIPGWGPLGENYLMSHRVVHVPFDDCREAICGQVPAACLKYPIKHYHVCFKSNYYGDVCSYDQGAPLLCPWFSNSILAILVKAFDCGISSLPAVYALLDRAADIRYYHMYRSQTRDLQPPFDWKRWERIGFSGHYSTKKPLKENFDN